jgi:hypothetical protein
MRSYTLALAAVAPLLLAVAVGAESTKTLRGEISVSGPFAVENLAGHMTVVAGDGDSVVAIVTVHAEDAALADTVRIERVSGEKGVPTLRVVYPVDEYRRFQFPSAGSAEVRYAGRRVEVSRHSGVLLWAEVEVRVPRRKVEATFRNVAGSLEAEGIEGTILLDASNGQVTARKLSGRITADTGSGNVRATDVMGDLICDTGSGNVAVTAFEGAELSCDTGSGTVQVTGVKAKRVKADTGSGGVRVSGADIEELLIDTGSGDVETEVTGSRLRRVVADTGSGSVRFRLPEDASFVIHTDQGSGDLSCRFADARPIVEKREVVGYRRGDEKTRIDVDTGSGSVTIGPR